MDCDVTGGLYWRKETVGRERVEMVEGESSKCMKLYHAKMKAYTKIMTCGVCAYGLVYTCVCDTVLKWKN